MAGPKIVHVDGYFRKDGTWVPPHTREWDGIKNPSPPKRSGDVSSADKPLRKARGEPEDSDDSGGEDRGGNVVAADGDWDDEDFDHLVDDDGKPVERPGVRMAGRLAARGIAPPEIPEDRIREWRDKDGKVVVVGWVGSRLDEILWIRTAKGESVRVVIDDLCLADQDFVDDMK